MTTIGKLSKAQYWQWKANVLEVQYREEQLKSAERSLDIMSKELEIAKLKAVLFKQNMDTVKNAALKAREEYALQLKELETKLNFSLRDSIIDEVTLEVKKNKKDDHVTS